MRWPHRISSADRQQRAEEKEGEEGKKRKGKERKETIAVRPSPSVLSLSLPRFACMRCLGIVQGASRLPQALLCLPTSAIDRPSPRAVLPPQRTTEVGRQHTTISPRLAHGHMHTRLPSFDAHKFLLPAAQARHHQLRLNKKRCILLRLQRCHSAVRHGRTAAPRARGSSARMQAGKARHRAHGGRKSISTGSYVPHHNSCPGRHAPAPARRAPSAGSSGSAGCAPLPPPPARASSAGAAQSPAVVGGPGQGMLG